MEGPTASPSVRQTFRAAPKVWPAVRSEAYQALAEFEPLRAFRRDLLLLVVLVVLAAFSRVWLIAHTEVAARDSVGFIRYALDLERYPWREVLGRSLQHPGYPLVLLAVSWPVRYFLGGTNAVSMQLSAQLASAMAGVLLVIPMYYLGRDLLGRRAGFWGTALFQCLPVSARVMSDALSEATFLLFIATALLFAVRAVQGNSLARFAWCGFFSGLAYLTRPEGALIVVAAGLVLIAMQCFSSWRQSWLHAIACGAALLVTVAAVGSPYVLVTGRLTNKPTPRRLFDKTVSEEAPPAHSEVISHGPLTASLLAIYAPENLKDRRLWGLYAVATEVTKDFQYLCVLPLVLGMWWLRERLKTPGAWVLLVLCSLHSLILWRLAVVVGYVSDRHVLVLALSGVFLAAGGVLVLG
jgi:hypothetical protein